MRVTLVSREHPSLTSGGGIGTYTMTIGAALARLGYEVEVLTRGTEPPRDEDGVRVLSVPHRPLPSATADHLLAARRVADAVRRSRPDVVQAAEWGADGWWLARRRTLPLVTRLATPTYLVDLLNHGSPRPGTSAIRRMEHDQAQRSAALVAPSRAIADRVAADWALDRSSIEVIPNPIDSAAVRAAGEKSPPMPLPERFVLYIGRIERRKGVEELAAALPRVLREHPEVHAVVLGRDAGEAGGGAGRQLDRLAASFPGRVHLLGALPRERALAVVARATIVVLPSHWEAFGFVATEAQALGRPVLATSGSGFGEIIEDGRNGWLVPPRDAGALAEALTQRLNDPEGLERISREARANASRFEADRAAETLGRVYERVAEDTREGGRFSSAIYARGYRRFFRPEDPAGPFHALYEAKRSTVLDFLLRKPPMDIIDVGCGPGRLLVPLAARHRMTGCDISAEMLEEARRHCPPEVRLLQADARRLPFEDESFDGLIALDLLTHLPALEDGLRELARVVRPGGTVVFDSSNSSPWWVPAYPAYWNWRPRRLVATMRRRGVLPEWSEVVRHHRSEEVREASFAAGLRIERVERFGPAWSAKWELWFAVKEGA